MLGASKKIPIRLMLSPLSNRHRHLTSKLVQASSDVRRRFYPALILVTVTVAGWGVGMYVHAFLLPK
jgi:hypothetical protein